MLAAPEKQAALDRRWVRAQGVALSLPVLARGLSCSDNTECGVACLNALGVAAADSCGSTCDATYLQCDCDGGRALLANGGCEEPPLQPGGGCGPLGDVIAAIVLEPSPEFTPEDLDAGVLSAAMLNILQRCAAEALARGTGAISMQGTGLRGDLWDQGDNATLILADVTAQVCLGDSGPGDVPMDSVSMAQRFEAEARRFETLKGASITVSVEEAADAVNTTATTGAPVLVVSGSSQGDDSGPSWLAKYWWLGWGLILPALVCFGAWWLRQRWKARQARARIPKLLPPHDAPSGPFEARPPMAKAVFDFDPVDMVEVAAASQESEAAGGNDAEDDGTDGLDHAVSHGARVRLRRLQSATASNLNGQEAICQGWDAGAKRWQVRLPNGAVKALRPENLELVKDLPSTRLYLAIFEGDAIEVLATRGEWLYGRRTAAGSKKRAPGAQNEVGYFPESHVRWLPEEPTLSPDPAVAGSQILAEAGPAVPTGAPDGHDRDLLRAAADPDLHREARDLGLSGAGAEHCLLPNQVRDEEERRDSEAAALESAVLQLASENSSRRTSRSPSLRSTTTVRAASQCCTEYSFADKPADMEFTLGDGAMEDRRCVLLPSAGSQGHTMDDFDNTVFSFDGRHGGLVKGMAQDFDNTVFSFDGRQGGLMKHATLDSAFSFDGHDVAPGQASDNCSSLSFDGKGPPGKAVVPLGKVPSDATGSLVTLDGHGTAAQPRAAYRGHLEDTSMSLMSLDMSPWDRGRRGQPSPPPPAAAAPSQPEDLGLTANSLFSFDGLGGSLPAVAPSRRDFGSSLESQFSFDGPGDNSRTPVVHLGMTTDSVFSFDAGPLAAQGGERMERAESHETIG